MTRKRILLCFVAIAVLVVPLLGGVEARKRDAAPADRVLDAIAVPPSYEAVRLPPGDTVGAKLCGTDVLGGAVTGEAVFGKAQSTAVLYVRVHAPVPGDEDRQWVSIRNTIEQCREWTERVDLGGAEVEVAWLADPVFVGNLGEETIGLQFHEDLHPAVGVVLLARDGRLILEVGHIGSEAIDPQALVEVLRPAIGSG